MSPTEQQLKQAARAVAKLHGKDRVTEIIGQFVPAGMTAMIPNVPADQRQALLIALDDVANPPVIYVPPTAPVVKAEPQPAPDLGSESAADRVVGILTHISVADHVTKPSQALQLTLSQIAERIASKPPVEEKIHGIIIHFAKFPHGAPKRMLYNCAGASAIVLDFDGRNGDTVKRTELEGCVAAKGLAALFYDSFSADGKDTTFRCVLPSAKLIPIELYKPAALYVCEHVLAIEAPKILPASQGYFCQSKPGNSPNVRHFAGACIDTTFDNYELTPETIAADPEAAAHGSELTPEKMAEAREVIAGLRAKGAHLSDGKGVWHRVIGALAPYGDQGFTLACEFSEGDDHYSEKVVRTKIKQKLKSGATGIGNLFAIAANEFGIANPGAGVRQSAAEAFGSSEVPDEVGAVSLDIPFDVDWPPGLVGEIARYVHQTCLVPVKSFSIATALFALSLLSANKFYVRRTDTGLNLYQVLSGPTGSGKEGPRKSLDKLFEGTVFANHIWETAASATGLLRAMSGDNEPVFAAVPDEFGLMMQSYAGKRANPNHVMLVKCWLQLFGCPRGTFKPTAYANDRDNIPPIYKPYFLLLGMTTPETLYPAFTKDMVDAGTVNRIIVVSLAGVEAENTDLDFTVPKALADSILAFDAAFSFAEEVPLEFEDGAFELLEQLAKNPDTEDTPAALWGRYREQVIRVAGVLAVGDGRLITKAHVIWAHRYVDWCVRGFVRKLVPRLAEGNFAELANKALEVIRNPKNYAGDKQFAKLCRKGLMPTGKLSKLLHIPSKEKATVVEYLLETQQIKCGNVDGQEVFWVPK